MQYLVLAGHKDSVTSVSFSHDGKLVATGDMSGVIQVWNVETYQKIWSFETGDLEVRTTVSCSLLRAMISLSFVFSGLSGIRLHLYFLQGLKMVSVGCGKYQKTTVKYLRSVLLLN